ncbi:ATP-binding protein [Streptomyces sp. NPDC059371]|uniref:ATP-binding protein n=1 Tax=Streptomyces sp. NPDC059371 TaxID=3346812 RepID=UPI003698D42B
MLGPRACPVRRAGTGKPTPGRAHGVPSLTQHIPFEPEAANLFIQFISGRYERASVIVTSNKPFGKAHMFRRTRARQRLNSTGSHGRGRSSSWTYPSCRDGDIRVGRHPGEDAGRLLATHRRGGQWPWRLLRQEPRRLR